MSATFVGLDGTGLLKEQVSNTANSLLALNSTGLIDTNYISETSKYRTAIYITTVDLEAGDFVFIGSDNKISKADANVAGQYAKGFVLDDAYNGSQTKVYLNGINTSLQNLQVGAIYYLNYNGRVDNINVGYNKVILQKVGVAISKDKLLVNLSFPQRVISQTAPVGTIPIDIQLNITEAEFKIDYEITVIA